MSIEQRFTKFNIEDFKNNFSNILNKYVRAEYMLEGVHDYEENQAEKAFNTTKEKELKAEMDTSINQMVSLTLESFKLSDNKQEILDTIYKSLSDSYYGSYDPSDASYALSKAEKNYFSKLILKLSITNQYK